MAKKSQAKASPGRPPIGDAPMPQAEISARHTAKLRSAGGRQYSLRVKSDRRNKVLRQFAKVQGLKSETAAATYLLEKAIDNAERVMNRDKK